MSAQARRSSKITATVITAAMFGIISISAAFVNPLFSADEPVTYLIWRGSFTESQLNTVRSYGYSKNDQPVKISRYFQPANTNYVMVSVATTTFTQNAAIQILLASGKIQPLETIYLRSAYDGRIGGNVSWVEKEDCKTAPEKYVCFPSDWGRDWLAVEVSSP